MLIDAVLNRGHREYRRYCQLAAKIADPKLLEKMEELSESSQKEISSRAKMMIEHIRQGSA